VQMDVGLTLEIEAAERDYLRTRVENLMRLDGNPYGALVFSNGAAPCFQVRETSSPMFNRIHGDSAIEPQKIVDLLVHSAAYSTVTPVIGPPSSLYQRASIAGRQLERLRGWTHLQLTCAIGPKAVSTPRDNIEEITPETIAAFAAIHAGGFHTKPAQRQLSQASFKDSDADSPIRIYVIKEAGEVVAGASMYVPSNGIAYLGTAVTRKDARGRGYHTALISHRIARAIELGSPRVAATALANSQSRRNLQRAGLEVSHAQALYRLPET
jgi:GNAT superfamily N-acetyltransferase